MSSNQMFWIYMLINIKIARNINSFLTNSTSKATKNGTSQKGSVVLTQLVSPRQSEEISKYGKWVRRLLKAKSKYIIETQIKIAYGRLVRGWRDCQRMMGEEYMAKVPTALIVRLV